jgi:type I restriction enzyme S subunit
MMECVLKDLIAVSKDGEWGKGEPFDESVEMLAIRGTDFEDVRFGFTASTPRRHIARLHAERKLLQPWDVVIEAAGGTKNQITGRTVLLRPQLFSRSELPFTCASFSRFIRFNTELCDPAFMFWYLQHLYASGLMHAYHTQHTGVARFQWTTFSEREPLSLPPLPVQRRIAGILSAYDELMENSQRRIRLLESMARALYREWFVHFRFPGHEKHPRVASPHGDIPKGWEVKTVKDVATVTYGFPFASKKFNTDGIGTPVIRIRDILDGSINTFTDEAVDPKYHIKNGDILVGMDGDFHMCIWSSGHAFQNQRVAKFESTGGIGSYHLFLALELPIQTWNKSIVGTTVAHLGDMHIKTIQIAWPPAKILGRAREILEPMSEQIIALKRQIRNLRRTRDLLLPRLLSGQVNLAEN